MRTLCATFGVCFVAVTSAAAQTPAGIISLFDGKTLNGWTVDNDYAKNFSIKDGLLHIEGQGGWLKSPKQYSDFTIKMEVRKEMN